MLRAYWPGELQRSVVYTTERIKDVLAYVGNPQDKPRAIHIAGTSGKTSTAYYAASLLKTAGKRVGLLTSPHIHALNERVQIDMVPLPEDEFCAELSIFLQLVEQSEVTLTYAEIMYAFAYWEFARKQVAYIVVEVGMGGLLDATNVMTRGDKVCVLTDIGMDHVHALGNTLAQITKHKAGIIGMQNAVFCYDQGPEVMHEIVANAQRKQADLHIADDTDIAPGLQFLPLFQQRNCNLALQAVHHVLARDGSGTLTPKQIKLAAMIRIPGRMEVIRYGDKTIIIDGAHNPQKLNALAASIRQKYPGQAVAVVVGFVASKGRSADELIAAVKPLADHVIVTTFPALAGGWHASRPASELQAACEAQAVASFEAIPVLPIAISNLLKRKEPVLVITGSFYMLGAVQARLEQLTA